MEQNCLTYFFLKYSMHPEGAPNNSVLEYTSSNYDCKVTSTGLLHAAKLDFMLHVFNIALPASLLQNCL